VLDNEFVYRIAYIVLREGQGTGVVIDYFFIFVVLRALRGGKSRDSPFHLLFSIFNLRFRKTKKYYEQRDSTQKKVTVHSKIPSFFGGGLPGVVNFVLDMEAKEVS